MFDFPLASPTTKKRQKIFDWSKPCHYDETQKAAFHRTAAARLRDLAVQMGWQKPDFDIRSNKAGIAVSGEITLHHERVYISVSQSRLGSETGILIRTCKGRKDYVGGRNTFEPLRLLDDIPALAARVEAVIQAGR